MLLDIMVKRHYYKFYLFYLTDDNNNKLFFKTHTHQFQYPVRNN